MRRLFGIAPLLIWALLSAFPASAADAPRTPAVMDFEDRAQADAPTLAILNFTNRNPGDGWDWLGVGLADMLVTDLGRSRNVQVVERERIALIQRELGVYSRVTEQNDATRCARIAAASHALFGLYSVAKGRVEIQAFVIRVAGASLVRIEGVQGAEADVLLLEKTLAERILQRMGLPMTEAELAAVRRYATQNVNAAARFYIGQQAMDGGDPQTALAEFRMAAQADAGYAKARLATAETYRRLGETAHAQMAFRSVVAGSPNTQEAAEALFGLSRVCRTLPDGADEALDALEKLRVSYAGIKLASCGFVPFSSTRTLDTVEFTLMETGDVLLGAGRFEEAIRAYQKVAANDPPRSSASAPVGFTPSGVMIGSRPMPSGARERIEHAVQEMYLRAGYLPSLPAGLVILTPQAPVYAEDYSTDKRLRDGWLIASAGTKRAQIGYEYGFVPASAGIPAGIRDVTDTYRFGAAQGYAFKSVTITLNGAPAEKGILGARVKHGYTRQLLYKFESGGPAGATAAKTVPLAPGTAFLVLDMYARNTQLTSWRVEAELERVEAAGRIAVESSPSRARVLLDGQLVGRTPCVIPNVPSGDHEVEFLWPCEVEVCEMCGLVHGDGSPFLFGKYRDKAKVTVAAGAESKAAVLLSPVESSHLAWSAPVCIAQQCSRNYDSSPVDMAVGRRNSGIVWTDGQSLWIARGTAEGAWQASERLPVAINGLAPATMPRLLQLDDERWLLTWKVSYPGFTRVMMTLSNDLRKWSAPVLVIETDKPVKDILLLRDGQDQPALFWLLNLQDSPMPMRELYCRNPLRAETAGLLGKPPEVDGLWNRTGIDRAGNVVLAAERVIHTATVPSRANVERTVLRGAPGEELRASKYGPEAVTGPIKMLITAWRVSPDGMLFKLAEGATPESGLRLLVSSDGAEWRNHLELPLRDSFSLLRAGEDSKRWLLWQSGPDLWVSCMRAK